MTRPLGCALALMVFGVAATAKADGTVNVKCGVNEDRVWVYESLVDFNVAAKLKCGEPVLIVGRVKGYVKIETVNGAEGYVVDTAFPKSALPPEPQEKPNDVESASLAFAARRASKGSTKSQAASTTASSSADSTASSAVVAGNSTPMASASTTTQTATDANATSAPPQVAMAVSTPITAPASPMNTTTSTSVVTSNAASDALASAPLPVKPQTAVVVPPPAATTARTIEASRATSPAPVVVASNALSSVPVSSNPNYAQPPVATVSATAAASNPVADIATVEPATVPPAPVVPKASASNSTLHPAPSRTMNTEPRALAVPEIKVSGTTPNVATPTSLPPTPKVEAAMSAPAAPVRAPASAPALNTAAPALAAPAIAPTSIAAAAVPPPAPAPPVPMPASRPISNAVAENRPAPATFQPVSNPISRPDAATKKPPVNPDEDEDTSVKALENENANCTVFFTAYGLSPNQYKWIAQNRLKAFPSVCPAPSPSMVDFVVIFTHDVAFYNVTMPDAVHFETNGFSDWTPLTTVDTALMNASDADKSHHEYVWVFRTTRGAFDPAKFSARRRPLFSKSETNTLGSRGGFHTVMDALTFIEQNGANR